jgi:hypothetical protein
MLGRLLEAAPESAARLKTRLKLHASNLVVYSYDGNLRDLAEKAGVRLLTPDSLNHVSLGRIM